MRRPYWLTFDHLRFVVRHGFWGFFQRGWRGWADHDTWGTDHHLARVTAGMLRHMAEIAHGFPMDILEIAGVDNETEAGHEYGIQIWKKWLTDKAEWFEWYAEDDLGFWPEMTEEERMTALNLYEKKCDHFRGMVLPDFYKHFETLWD